LYVLLFFTDSLDLCLNRAKKRHENGLHLVEPETIKTMYNQTIHLFKENFNVVDRALFIDVNEISGLKIAAEYNRDAKRIDAFESAPAWFTEKLYPFLKQQVQL
jgi:predicted ABC-type ATPase